MHTLREQQIQEVFQLEKQLQEMRFGKESAEKALEAKKSEFESYTREKGNKLQMVAGNHQKELEQ